MIHPHGLRSLFPFPRPPRYEKVVRRTSDNSEGFLSDAPALSGTKRSRANGSAQDSLFYTNKRLQEDIISRNSGYTGSADVSLSGNDLRLKLLHKRMSRRIEEQKKKELLEKMSWNTQSSEGPERSLSRNIAPLRRAGESLRMESLQSSYSSYTVDGLRIKAPTRNPQMSGGISSSRAIGEVLQSPMPVLASRAGRMVSSDLLDPLQKGPTSMRVMAATTRTSLDPSKPFKDLPPASSSMLRNTYADEHLTVTSLLHSLGLGKYAILFQAEEVDMAALKQMGDRDLKELGIPMGPRKKILIAMLPRAKRPSAGLPSAA
ncbi:uncharacterized protein [Coffea arabica]|uniref:Uncharacterized protein isoform X1 n=1 Tax=Coffea arabica TaxID=13443 RepID=A0ABM4V4Z6_COFAR